MLYVNMKVNIIVHDPKKQELKKERYEKRQGLKRIFYYSKILKKRDSHAKK